MHDTSGGTGATARYRLLACDLDGTLLAADGCFPPQVVAFFHELDRAGIRVVAATGRRLHSALPLLRDAGRRGPCVVQNGAIVADVERAERLRTVLLEPQLARTLIERLEGHGLAPLVYRDVPAGPDEVLIGAEAPDPTGFLRWYLEYARGHHTRVDALSRAPLQRVVRITAHDQREVLESVQQDFSQHHPDSIGTLIGLDPVRRVHRLEIMARGADKWSALAWVLEREGIDPESVVAVGDDANDLELLERAGWSLAAPGATARAREVARERVEGEGPTAVVAALRRRLGTSP